MGRIKSIYISVYLTVTMIAGCYALLQSYTSGSSAWLGAAVALWGVLAFFAHIFVVSTARTSANLWPMITVAAFGSLLAALLPVAEAGSRSTPLLLALTLGLGGALVYVFWYSRLDRPDSELLRVGQQLPEFELEDVDGHVVSSREFLGRPALLMFYRGNWCPLCSAQIRELAAQYRELERRGVCVALISPQSHDNSRRLAERFQVNFRFLVDPGVRAGRRLRIHAEGGTPAGMELLGYDSDTVLPTVLITDAEGRIVYADLTDNYRVRPEPETFFGVFDRLPA